MAGPPNPGFSLTNAGHVTNTRSRSTENREEDAGGIIRSQIRFECDPLMTPPAPDLILLLGGKYKETARIEEIEHSRN